MSKNTNYNYLLFGNPVNHSKSPIIYNLFSLQTGYDCNYGIKCVTDGNFENEILDFLKNFGLGANITVPFKEKAIFLTNSLTARAKLSQSVNVLKKDKNKIIYGDNTDGLGLIYDLKRLNFIQSKYKILLIGAGGAARGIIPNLLELNCRIDIINRTFDKAYNLSVLFNKLGYIKPIDISDLYQLNYDLVINATSIGIRKSCDFFLSNIDFYPSRTVFYDLYYSDDMTVFLKWCKENGAIYYSDGIGMLVSQAAYCFYFWHGIFPNIVPVIKFLNKDKNYFF